MRRLLAPGIILVALCVSTLGWQPAASQAEGEPVQTALANGSDADVPGYPAGSPERGTLVNVSAAGSEGQPEASVRKPYTFIVIASYPDQVADYRKLEGPRTHFAFRNIPYDINSSQVRDWDAAGTPYYFTAASSDYPAYQDRPLYETVADMRDVVSRPANEGLYLHETLSYLAYRNGWKWTTAVEQLDWAWLDQIAAEAAARGKKVVWSEPANGWQYLTASPRAQAFFQQWANSVVPMFATNFDTPDSGFLMRIAREFAAQVAVRYKMPLGQSHQSWHFRDRQETITQDSSFALARYAEEAGATYYQIEGTYPDVRWSSEYMLGVRGFAEWLNTR